VGEEGKGKAVRLAGTFDMADRESRLDELSAPEVGNESPIDTASHYKHPESCAETEHRYEKAKMSGRSCQLRRSMQRLHEVYSPESENLKSV
jgi:hypothetical protein